MKTHFIDTIAVNSDVYLFRFTKDPQQDKYVVCMPDNKVLKPFSMCRDRAGHWLIQEDVSGQIKDFEILLSNVINAANREFLVLAASKDILKRIQTYSKVYKDAKPNRDNPHIGIDTLMLDMKVSKEEILDLLRALHNNGEVVLVTNDVVPKTNRPTLVGTVTLVG